jgi:molybdopterin molybdotransferase
MADRRYRDALAILREVGRVHSHVTAKLVPLSRAVGRISATRLTARDLVPPHRNSAVDGFALRSEWTVGASPQKPCRIPVLEGLVSVAGDAPSSQAPLTGAHAIMTGAPFPPHFDASVKIEEFELVKNSQGRIVEIAVTRPIEAGEFSRDAGEDFAPGDSFLEAGQPIGPEQLLAAATLGYAELPVLRRPRAIVISTGRELVDAAETPQPGQIRNATAPYLLAALKELGFKTSFGGAVGDEPEDFERTISKALKDGPEAIVTTGAVSMGVHDYVPDSIAALGGRVHFHRLAIRPGKPIFFAELGATAVFGLPGNPVSTVVGARFFIEPYLRALQNRLPETPLRARLENDFRKPEGLRCFFKARFDSRPDAPLGVHILPGQASFMISPLLRSDAWAVLDEEISEARAGQEIDVYPLHPRPDSWAGPLSQRSSGDCC